MELRREDAAEDFRRAADVVVLEKRAKMRGGGKKLPGPSLSDDIMYSLPKPAMMKEYVKERERKALVRTSRVAGRYDALPWAINHRRAELVSPTSADASHGVLPYA